MPNIPAKFTRLELVIIVAALVVLLFSNQPPERGSAEIRTDTGLTAESRPDAIPQMQPGLSQSPTISEPESLRAVSPDTQSSSAPGTDNLTTVSISQPRPRPKRFATVDARKCDSLKYPNIMVGEITARRVWNGTTFEWDTVCEVRERNGTITLWNLNDRHEGVIITELPPDPASTY